MSDSAQETRFQNETELIRRYLGGDMLAFEALVGPYQKRIYNFSLQILRNPEDAGDVTQEIFILALRKLHTFRSESKFSTWLYSIAANSCKDFLRRRKPVVLISDDAMLENALEERARGGWENDPARLAETRDISSRVREEIFNLPLNYRNVVVLRDLQDQSYDDIAQILDISVGTVKSRLSRARFKLSGKLSDLGEQSSD